MAVGDLDDPASEVSRLIRANKTQVNKPEAGTKPRIHYIV
jgi:Fe-S-cluster-containing dehydrogenase component